MSIGGPDRISPRGKGHCRTGLKGTKPTTSTNPFLRKNFQSRVVDCSNKGEVREGGLSKYPVLAFVRNSLRQKAGRMAAKMLLTGVAPKRAETKSAGLGDGGAKELSIKSEPTEGLVIAGGGGVTEV